MTICGIIAEYNPFHLGHVHHLIETRRRLDPDTLLVCAMSGNFVQRGDLALLDKYERAAMAAECGADLVVELPLTAALSSAEGFAQGGVRLLAALGCSHISFGAECDDLPLLLRAASLLRAPALAPLFAAAMHAGMSYPAAVQHAASQLDSEAAALFSAPNNTLGIAYCSEAAVAGMEPLPVRRVGAGHDAPAARNGFASASYLRRLILLEFFGDDPDGWDAAAPSELCPEDWRAFLPTAAADRLAAALQQERAPMIAAFCDTALLSHLRRLGPAELKPYAPGSDGFAERLHLAIQKGCTFREVCGIAQTRRYTLAHIRRTLLRAYLDLPAALPVDPQYIRVLALGPGGAEVLRDAALPVITKPAAERRLPDALQPALQRDALSDALYTLASPTPSGRSAGTRWRKTPFVMK